MNNVIHASVNVESKRIEPKTPSGDLRIGLAPDCAMLRTTGLVGLSLREIGPVGRRLIFERRHRDAALDVPRVLFEQAYVCALLDIESFVGQPLENDDEIGRAIDFIEEARRFRADDPLMGRAGDLLAVYRPPTVAQLRWLRTRHSRSQVVADHRFPNFADEGVCDREGLLYAIGGNPIWIRLWTAFAKAVAACLRSADPNLDWSSPDAEVWRAINRVSLEQRLRVRFEPSRIREWL
jgi:hypothetical protein